MSDFLNAVIDQQEGYIAQLENENKRYKEALKHIELWAKGDIREVAKKALEG